MKMKKLTRQKKIDQYLKKSGKNIINCVGAYNIEGYGSGLFKKLMELFLDCGLTFNRFTKCNR